jgi:hypothetical protein
MNITEITQLGKKDVFIPERHNVYSINGFFSEKIYLPDFFACGTTTLSKVEKTE